MSPTDLLLARPAAFRHAAESPRAPLWMSSLLLLTGAAYGLLVARFQVLAGAPLQGVPVAEIPPAVLLGGNLAAGILVVLVLHGGVTLLLWLMARAVGGPGHLGLLYRVGAYLLPLGLPALPRLAAGSAGVGGPGLDLLAVLGAGWLLVGLHRALRATQGFAPSRAAAAVALFTVFSGSILLAL